MVTDSTQKRFLMQVSRSVAVLRGVQGALALGSALMVAKRGPTPKRKDRNFKEMGPADVFGPGLRSP